VATAAGGERGLDDGKAQLGDRAQPRREGDGLSPASSRSSPPRASTRAALPGAMVCRLDDRDLRRGQERSDVDGSSRGAVLQVVLEAGQHGRPHRSGSAESTREARRGDSPS